jgi:WD40 repeat protein
VSLNYPTHRFFIRFKIYTLLEGNETATVKTRIAHNNAITCYAISHSARSMVTGSADQSIKVWNLQRVMLTQVSAVYTAHTDCSKQVLVGHDASVSCVCIADDERIVVSASDNHALYIWETVGQQHARTTVHMNTVERHCTACTRRAQTGDGDSRGSHIRWQCCVQWCAWVSVCVRVMYRRQHWPSVRMGCGEWSMLVHV